MKPRTKLQHQVYSLSKNLDPISKEQKQWAFKNCLKHIGYRTKSNVFCLDCGNVWNGSQKAKSLVCPTCKTKLTIEDTRKKKLDQTRLSLGILQVVDGFQVVRIFEINSYHRAGFAPNYHVWEVVQQWFKPDDRLTIVARTCSFGNIGWGGDLEIRTNLSNYYNSNKYDLYVDGFYPTMGLLPIYKRNGFTSKVGGENPYSLLKTIISNSKAETLIKAKQFSLLNLINGSSSGSVYRFWDSIKICIRQKYIVKDAKTWLDYLELLAYFRKDLRSPKYVCTKTLKKDHDRLVLKKTEHLKKQADIKRRAKIESAEIAYLKDKGKFMGIVITDGDLTIKFLESVTEFMNEGDFHKHCVFTNEYYAKPDSLIFSAKIGNVPIETIEVSISKMKIQQSRGLNNTATIHNKRIVSLLNKNIHLIKERVKPLSKRKVANKLMGAVA